MYRYLIVAFLVLLAALSFSAPASAHSAHPAHAATTGINCYYDACDGFYPHDTDGGSHCTTPNLVRVEQFAMNNHSGRRVGDLDLYWAQQCETFYATVYSYYGQSEINTVTLHTTRSGQNGAYDPDAASFSNTYSITLTNTFADGRMAGLDDGYDGNECYTPNAIWHDYAGVTINVAEPAYCLV